MSAQAPAQLQLDQEIQAPWFAGAAPITQLWGPTDYDGEPEGHGYPHWHAGIDIGLACGTTLLLPHGVAAVAEPFLNPGGYGTALKLQVGTTPGIDIILGHLRQVLVSPGQQLLGGEQIAVSNNTGNSTGCHLHFEVRPRDGRYGTDIDPTGWLLNPNGEGVTQPTTTPPGGTQPGYGTRTAGDNPVDAISSSILSFSQMLVAQTQAGLGLMLMVAGGIILVLAARGSSVGAAVEGAASFQRGRMATQARQRAVATRAQARAQAAERTVGERAERDRIRQAGQERRETVQQYRAGLVGQAEAQRRLGVPVKRTGPRKRKRQVAAAEESVVLGGKKVKLSELSPAMQAAVRNPASVTRLRPNLQPSRN